MVQMKYTQLLVMFLSSCIGFSKAIAVPPTPSPGSGSAFLEIEDKVTQPPRSQLQVESVTNAIEVGLLLKMFHSYYIVFACTLLASGPLRKYLVLNFLSSECTQQGDTVPPKCNIN